MEKQTKRKSKLPVEVNEKEFVALLQSNLKRNGDENNGNT